MLVSFLKSIFRRKFVFYEKSFIIVSLNNCKINIRWKIEKRDIRLQIYQKSLGYPKLLYIEKWKKVKLNFTKKNLLLLKKVESMFLLRKWKGLDHFSEFVYIKFILWFSNK